jgi:hypothetical protein
MNDLDLLAQLGNETPLPDPASLAPARARVVAGLTVQRHRPSRRTVITGSAVVAAAAVAAAVTFSSLAPASHPAQLAGGNVTAVQLLDFAAAAALTQPPVIPKPDQYVYVKAITGGVVTQVWTPVDDNLSGLIKQGNEAPAVTSEERPGFYPGMPTSASAMPGFFAGLDVDVHDVYFVHLATEILSNDYLLPAQRAAFYKYLATVQGASVVSDVRDAAGRLGTGLVWKVQGVKWMLIFNSRTFAYLGVKLADASAPGDWVFSDAQLQKAIVNRPGQLP